MTARSLQQQLDSADKRITRLLAKYSLTALRIAVGIVFVWFGALKLVPDLSPAEPLIRQSITFLPMNLFMPFLAVWEMAIGVGFITGKFMRATLILLLLQMGGAMSPLILRPDLIWAKFPYAWTLEGQYVFKDIVFISVGLVIGATVRGGGLVADPSELARNLKLRTQEFKRIIAGDSN